MYRYTEKDSKDYEESYSTDAYASKSYAAKETSVPFDWVTELIQNSRVDGLGSYNAYREVCGWKRAKKFEDFYDLIKDNGVSTSRY